MKKLKIIKNILVGILIILCFIIISISSLFIISSVGKKDSLSVFPHEYSIYLHMDKAWNTVEPMLDLKAMDMFLSTPELTNVRGMFMQLRASSWRNNFFLSKIASKSIDAALYKNDDNKYNFLACIDLGSLSFLSKLFPIITDKIKNFSQNEDYYVFNSNGTYYYIKSYKNLLIASDSEDLLKRSTLENYNTYNEQQLQILKQKSSSSLRIVANTTKIMEEMQKDNKILKELEKALPENDLSMISINLTDEKINIKVEIPFTLPEHLTFSDKKYLFEEILNTQSTTPSVISRLTENVQYYTILNTLSLEQLKNTFLPIIINDAQRKWSNYDNFSRALFSLSIEDLLFSWSGKEVVIFGLENKNDPIFAIQVKDEKQRQKVFEKFTSSMLIQNDSSLILDGVRIPRLEVPAFIQDLLKLFEISLPHPYYYIQDGFIYFSESAENLCELYKGSKKVQNITADNNWKTISKGLGSDATVSLFYNLERSIPFFLKKNASLSNILSLYQIGRADLIIKEGKINLQLSAISKEIENLNKIPGFPISLHGTVDGKLYKEATLNKAKNSALYWIENKKTICVMELPSTSIIRKEMQDEVFIDTVPKQFENCKGVLWVVTSHGEVYLFDRKLQTVEGFPKFLGESITLQPVASSDGINIVTEQGHIHWLDNNGHNSEQYLDLFGSIKSAPSIYEYKGNRYCGIYDKSFFGKILIHIEGENIEDFEYDLQGIAYGSPSFCFSEKKFPYVSMITQNGEMHIWDMNTNEQQVIALEGLFKCAPVNVGEYFMVVSTDGVVYRVRPNFDYSSSLNPLESDVVKVRIPNVTCNEAFIYANNDVLYICPDGNIIYGFDKNLELVYPFPITGWGIPQFVDVNGDNILDCFCLTIDNKLSAIKMR